jgi:hypothetical protein
VNRIDRRYTFELATRIITAVHKYGWCSPSEARLYIGSDEAWSVIGMNGGWEYLCENLGGKISIMDFLTAIPEQIELQMVNKVYFEKHNTLEDDPA